MLANSRPKSTPSTKSSSPDRLTRESLPEVSWKPFSCSNIRLRNASRNCQDEGNGSQFEILSRKSGSDLLARRQVETPDWLRQDHGGSLFAGWPPSADGAFPMPARLEQFPRVWKEQFPGNWTNGCSFSERPTMPRRAERIPPSPHRSDR